MRDFEKSSLLSTGRSRVIDTNDNYKCPTRSFTHEGNTESHTHTHTHIQTTLSHLPVPYCCGCRIGECVAYTSLWICICTVLHTEHSAHCEDLTAENYLTQYHRSFLFENGGERDDVAGFAIFISTRQSESARHMRVFASSRYSYDYLDITIIHLGKI